MQVDNSLTDDARPHKRAKEQKKVRHLTTVAVLLLSNVHNLPTAMHWAQVQDQHQDEPVNEPASLRANDDPRK